MKTLFEIIELTKDGGKSEYDELRYALLAMCSLHHFDLSALRKLYKMEQDGKYHKEMFGLEWEVNESFDRNKRALDKSPKDWLGPNHDPDNPDYQQFRNGSKKLFDKIFEQTINKNKEEITKGLTVVQEALKQAEVHYDIKGNKHE
jgi:hypothetical protein